MIESYTKLMITGILWDSLDLSKEFTTTENIEIYRIENGLHSIAQLIAQ